MTRTPPNRSLPRLALRLLCAVVLIAAVSPATARVPSGAAFDAEVARAMTATQSRGLAIAVIDKGRVVRVRSYGARNTAGAPLQTDTSMIWRPQFATNLADGWRADGSPQCQSSDAARRTLNAQRHC